jgi:hypothetical protein
MKAIADKPIANQYFVTEYTDTTPLVTAMPIKVEEPFFYSKQSAKSGMLPRLISTLDFVIVISLALLLCAEILHYVYLWPLPNEEASFGDFTYPRALIGSIQLLGLCLLTITGCARTWFVDSDVKSVWWLGLLGLLVSFSSLTVVIFRDDVFVKTLITGTFTLNPTYFSVYSATTIGIGLLVPALAIVDVFDTETEQTRYYRLMVVVGTFTKQISLIVTIHSIIVQVGFGFFVFGVLLIFVGYIFGLRHWSRLDASV